MTHSELHKKIEADPCASFWLKKAMCTAEGRDILDALRDAETLLAYCKLRAIAAGLTN